MQYPPPKRQAACYDGKYYKRYKNGKIEWESKIKTLCDYRKCKEASEYVDVEDQLAYCRECPVPACKAIMRSAAISGSASSTTFKFEDAYSPAAYPPSWQSKFSTTGAAPYLAVADDLSFRSLDAPMDLMFAVCRPTSLHDPKHERRYHHPRLYAFEGPAGSCLALKPHPQPKLKRESEDLFEGIPECESYVGWKYVGSNDLGVRSDQLKGGLEFYQSLYVKQFISVSASGDPKIYLPIGAQVEQTPPPGDNSMGVDWAKCYTTPRPASGCVRKSPSPWVENDPHRCLRLSYEGIKDNDGLDTLRNVRTYSSGDREYCVSLKNPASVFANPNFIEKEMPMTDWNRFRCGMIRASMVIQSKSLEG